MELQMTNPEMEVGAYDDPMDAIADRLAALEDDELQAAEEDVKQEAKTEEETEVESEEEAQENEFVEIKHNGKPVKLRLDEVIEHAQKGFDYTVKTQEIAEQRKAIEQYAETVRRESEFQKQFLQEYANLASMDTQLHQYQSVNWDAWMDSDPVEASKGWQRFQMLRQNRDDTARQIQTRQFQAQQELERYEQNRLMESSAQLERELGKEWNQDTRKALQQTGESYGFSREELGGIKDPRVVKVLLDAHKWRQMNAAKPNVSKKVADAPKIAKPGGKAQTTNAQKVQSLRSQLRKDGKMASATALMESLI